MTDELVAIGDVLLGKYRVERVLGRGGMGLVVAARHIELGELFAIKFLLPQALEHAEAVERFLREARTSARLKGVHVAKVHDVGRMDGGTPYMIMEHLAGTDLLGLIKSQQGPLPIEDVLLYVAQASEAVAEAHALGIVHRDLKPANMFLIRLPSGAPCVKVLDFGISKQLGPEDGWSGGLTQTGTLLGSPLYMSPEQIQAKPVDVRSDVWALGAVFFELLTGRPPYLASIFSELIVKVVLESPPSPAELRADVSPELAAVVLKCLAKRPEDRFQSVPELMAALRTVGAPRTEGASWPDRPSGIVSVSPGSGAAGAVTASGAPAAATAFGAPVSHPASAGPTSVTLAVTSAPSVTPAAPVSALPPPPALSTLTAGPTGQASVASSNIVTAESVQRAAAPPPSGSAGRFAIMALVAAAAIGGTALVMSWRAPPPEASPAASASAPLAAAPSVTATASASAGAVKSPRPKNWWDELPDGSSEAKTAKLPAPRLKWLRLYNRATVLENEQKHDEAQAALREALDVARKQLAPEDPAFRETLILLAKLAAKTGKLEDAEKLLREALQAEQRYGDPATDGFDDPRQALVAVLVKQGKGDEAKQFWKDSDPPLPPPPASAAPSASAPPVKAAPPKPVRPPDPFAPWAAYNKEKK